MEFNVTVRCLPALMYIDPDDVEDCFDKLCENPLLPDELVQYFLKNYCIGEWRGRSKNRKRMTPRYPKELWNHHWHLNM